MDENGEDVLFINAPPPAPADEAPKQRSTGKLIKTVALSAAFLGLGLAIAIPGPTLPYLQQHVDTTTDKIGIIFTCRSVGYLAGSLGSGWLFDHFINHRDVMFSVSLLSNAIGLAVAPWTTNLVVLALLTATTGVAMGVLDTGGNVVCLHLWGPRSPPYMQALHFSFGVGAVAAPLIAAPFLGPSSTGSSLLPHDNISATVGSSSTASEAVTLGTSTTMYQLLQPNLTNTSSAATEYLSLANNRIMFDSRINTVQFVYLLMGSFLLAVSLAFAAFDIRRCATGATQKFVPKSTETEELKRTDMPFLIKMTALLFLFYVFYAGLEVAYGQFIATYAISQDDPFAESKASLLTAVFWGVFTLGRGCAIFVARCCSPTKMLLGSFACSLVALLFLCFATGLHEAVLWIFSGMLGFGLAAIFPTGFTWAEQHLHLTAKVASVFVVGASVGEMALPATIGVLIAKVGPMYMMYAILGFGLLDAGIFVLLCILASPSCLHKEKYSVKGAEDIAMKRLDGDKSEASMALAPAT